MKIIPIRDLKNTVEIEEAKLLLDGIKDVQNNNILDGKNTINELKGKYGI